MRWFFTRLRGGATTSQVASLDRFGVVRKDARNSSSDISIERKGTHTYMLNIHGTQDSDSGEYHCVATPWYLSASTGAWTQAGELTSTRIFLTVRFAVWESLQLPLFYGLAASIGVGLFSLVLGLVCAHCCCRNTAHTPRSRNKLMDLEMDWQTLSPAPTHCSAHRKHHTHNRHTPIDDFWDTQLFPGDGCWE